MGENSLDRGNRLYPSIFGSLATRYYYLHQLRKKIQETITLFIATKNTKLLIADYGCGDKPYESLVTQYASKYIGIDLPENPIADIHVLPNGKIDMTDNYLDVAFSTQVLEHVTDTNLYLSEANRILKNDGVLILSTHGYWMFHPDPTDYWRWTSMGLKKIIGEQGFEIVYFEGILGRASMGLQLFQDGIMFKLPSFLKVPLALVMQPMIMLADKLNNNTTRAADACTYIVVAKKIRPINS